MEEGGWGSAGRRPPRRAAPRRAGRTFHPFCANPAATKTPSVPPSTTTSNSRSSCSLASPRCGGIGVGLEATNSGTGCAAASPLRTAAQAASSARSAASEERPPAPPASSELDWLASASAK
jgi:hypothetical protein